ncbi:ty3-gypsy retrotransposon protein [Tanacetum coccineum]
MTEDEADGEADTDPTTDAVESGDISILNSLMGQGSPRGRQKLGKVTHDYALQTMKFTLASTTYTLKGDESLRMKLISLNHMHVFALIRLILLLSAYRVIDHRIHLLPNMKPVNVKPYRYPHYQKGEIERRQLLFFVDYRALNEVTVKDKFLIPTADEMFDELGGAVILTKLDLRAGYHQICVHNRDVYKMAFRTYDGHYEFLVMPFGLTNVPSTFQARMNQLFSPYLRKFVIAHQFYVKRSKCAFGATTLEYLGHIITGVGVEVDPKKIAAVSEWPTPKTQRRVRGFLRLAGYYQRFIKGIEYKPGAQNTVAYAFSRVFKDSESLTASFMHLSQPLTVFLSDLKAENNRYYVGAESKLKPLLLWEFYDMPSSGHEGVKKMMVGLSAVFYWKGMRKIVEAYACSDSLLLTPLCCDDIHDVTPRVFALAGCDRLVSESGCREVGGQA